MSREMVEVFTAALVKQLPTITQEEVAIRYIEPVEHSSRRRDDFRQGYERRLRNADKNRIQDDYVAALRSAVRALDATDADEQFFSWSVKTSTGFISGISTVRRPILVLTGDSDHNPIT